MDQVNMAGLYHRGKISHACLPKGHGILLYGCAKSLLNPALLPMMISLFGWSFVLLFTLLTVAASFCVGFCINRLFP